MNEFSRTLLLNAQPHRIQQVLDGNLQALSCAFPWGSTPHGGEYWAEAEEFGVLTDESRSYLIRLRDAVLAREKGE